jgi:hypothetical protein
MASGDEDCPQPFARELAIDFWMNGITFYTDG